MGAITGIITTQKLGTYFARETFYHERGIYLEERTKALLVGVNLNNDPEFETALKELEVWRKLRHGSCWGGDTECQPD